MRFVRLICILLLSVGIPSFAQRLATGLYAHGSFDARGFDTINIGNLNTHFEIPIVAKKGRGQDFNYTIVYDSLIWSTVAIDGILQWTPDPSWGFKDQASGGATSYVTYNYQAGDLSACSNPTAPPPTEFPTYSAFTFYDAHGLPHVFNLTITDDCLGAHYAGGGSANDGSGYQFSWYASDQAKVTTINGSVLTVPLTTDPATLADPSASSVDPNGNIINKVKSGSITLYYDTTGNLMMTAGDRGTASSPQTFVYPVSHQSDSVTSATATAHYQTYAVRTNFQCTFVSTPIAEYPETNIDLIDQITLADGSAYTFTYEPTPGLPGNITGRLHSITLPTGGTITYEYRAGCGAGINADGTVGALTRTTSDGSRTYDRTPINGNATTTTVQDVLGNQSVYTFGIFAVTQAFYETRRKIYQGTATGTPLQDLQTCYSGLTQPCDGKYFTFPFSKTETYETLNGLQQRGSTVLYSYNDLPTEKDDYDFGGASSRGSLLRKEIWSYLPSIPNLVTSDEVFDGSANSVSHATFGYDEISGTGHAALATTSGLPQRGTAAPLRGNLTTSSQWLNSPNSTLSTYYKYDDTGQVLAKMDARGYTTSYAYDAGTDTFLQHVSSPTVGSVTVASSALFDPVTGVAETSTDPNGQITTYKYYDRLLRTTEVDLPDGGQTKSSRSSATETVISTLKQVGTYITATNIVDGYGRPLQAIQHDSVGGDVLVDYTYDGNGAVHTVSNPHRSSSSATDGVTTYSYDALGRRTGQTGPDGNSRGMSYSANVTTSTDERGNSWVRTSNAFGQLTNVVEPNGAATVYSYDTLGNLLSVHQNGITGNTPRVRSFTYDSLSRLTSATSPETGLVVYNYDANGNLQQKADTRGTRTDYTYDALNRLTSKSFIDGTPSQYFYYDQTNVWMGPQQNTIGRLSQAITGWDLRYFGSGSLPACNPQSSSTANYNPAYGNPTYCNWTDELYSYDAMGRQTHIGTAFPSEAGWAAHGTSVEYDLAGNMKSLTYPDGRVVTQGTDAAGHLQSVTYDNWNGQHVGYTYASGFTYTPAGAQTEVTFGNNVYTHVPYNNRQQACQTWVQTPTQALIDTHIYYGGSTIYCNNTPGNNGNITQVQDFRNPDHTQGFSYDSLNRLAAFSTADGLMQQSFSYDSFGNLSQSGTASSVLTYDANNHVNSGGYTYDAAGNINIINNGVFISSYAFDAESKLFNFNAGAAYYSYDANGERMRKDTNGEYTEYQYLNGQPIAERHSDGTWSDYIYANGQRIARADSYDNYIHIHGTMAATGNISTWHFPFNAYPIRSGDKVSWRQLQLGGARGGLGMLFTDGTYATTVAQDTDGQLMNDDTSSGNWHSRTVDLSNLAGKTISQIWMVVGTNTQAVTWDSYYADIAMYRADGTITPLYTGQSSVSLTYSATSGVSNSTAGVEQYNNVTHPGWIPTNEVFYHGDQIGSTRLTTSAGGWPLSGDTFYPFGQEPSPSADPNHYKFAGLERDGESNLDHAMFRQYSSTTGRWISPDPYNGSMDLSNPQSLNRYSYVMNGPLSATDPLGLAAVQCGSIICDSLQTSVFANAGDAIPWNGIFPGIQILMIAIGVYVPPSPPPSPTPHVAPNNTPQPCLASKLNADTRTAAMVGAIANLNGALGQIAKVGFVYATEKSGGIWDFKNQPYGGAHPELDDFGNYHYGAVGRAIGLPDSFMNWAAGAASWGHYHSKGKTDPYGSPFTGAPYGDNPENQYWIKQGQQNGHC